MSSTKITNGNTTFSRNVNTINWAVQTIGKHVIAQNALAGGGVGVGIEESTNGGVIIPGLQIIQAQFSILKLAGSSNFS